LNFTDIGLVSFMEYDLGYFDLQTRVLEPLEKSIRPTNVLGTLCLEAVKKTSVEFSSELRQSGQTTFSFLGHQYAGFYHHN